MLANNLYSKDYLQLDIDKTRLLIAQESVSALESTLDIQHEQAQDRSIGTISNNGETYRVFNFDANIIPERELSASRKVCVCLLEDDISFAITCDSVSRIDIKDIELLELPICMQTKTCPVLYLGMTQERIYNLVSIKAMKKLIATFTQTETASNELTA